VERLPSLRYIITDAANICQTKYYPFPHLWSRPQLILKFRKNPEDAALPILPVELPECQRRFTCASCCFTHYITGKYVLDFHEGDRFWCTAPVG
jgi:acetyl-CoA synthetase